MNDIVKDSRAYQYALWCREPDNHYVGRYVKRQAKIWIDIADGKSEEGGLNHGNGYHSETFAAGSC